jgi:C4-dicarboxylate transporter DctM subunit
VPIGESYKGVMPFLISDTLRTLLLLFFPPISLWLVQYVGNFAVHRHRQRGNQVVG